jgi:protein-disulfide isomerase
MKRAIPFLVLSLFLLGCVQSGGLNYGPQATVSPQLAAKSPVSVEGRLLRGPPNATVVIAAYSDFQCPFCARAAGTLEQVLAAYPNQVAFVFKHFPLTVLHAYALKSAEAFECAAEQGKGWEMHDKMFRAQPALDTASLKRYARDLGVDGAAFDACLDGGRANAIVSRDLQEGARQGVESTPTFYINNKRLVGAFPFERFKEVIDAELAGAA